MFHNGKRTIGVFIQQVNEEYQNVLCRGIAKKAQELDYNVAIFTNFGGYGQEVYDNGERNIVNLPNYEEFDAVILAPDTMNLKGLEQLYRDKIKNRCQCPVVSVRKEREDCYNVLADNHTILEKIITHFIEEHKFTRINFLSGPKEYMEIDKRLDSYKRILKDHGIPVEEERIYYGDLWKNEAYRAIDLWLDSSLERPQAIVCANDVMAITVCKALARRGLSVPEDIAVSGCDNIEDAEEFVPAITTAQLPVIEMGMEAVEKIHKHHLGISQPITSYVPSSKTIYRASCGCFKEREVSDRKLMKISSGDSLHNEIMRIAQMTTDLTSMTSLDDAINKISNYWFEYESISHIYLCLRENWDISEAADRDDENPYMIMQTGLQNKVGKVKIKFLKKDLLPPEFAEEQAMTFIFALLHYQERDFGYIGFRFEAELTSMHTLQAWLNNISSVLENVRMHIELNRMVNRLEDMSIRDELTGLYNRRVLDTLGKKSLEQSRKENSKLMFFIADMDKLKYINDKFGHAQGDYALTAIAKALQAAADDDEICIRLSGDEFMAIGMDYDDSKAERFIRNFVEELNRTNCMKDAEFGVYVSYGWSLIHPDANTTLEECMFAADYRMYQQKYSKVTNNIRANLLP